MRRIHIVFTAVIITLIFSINTFASKPNKSGSNISKEIIEENLLTGLKSDNLGLRISTAYFLGEYKTVKSVIPLMSILHNEKAESARILSALALIKIGDSRGVFAVRQAAKFDESARVRRMCGIFYKAYQNNDVEY